MSRLSAMFEIIDPETSCWLERKRFDIADHQALATALSLDEIELNGIYDLEPDDLTVLEREFGIVYADKSMTVRMSVDHGPEHFPYDEQASHTGRELLLMLAGKKPLAVFSEEYPLLRGDSLLPEAYFDVHVASGRFVKVVEITEKKPGYKFGTRRVLYALPDQQWRIDAYRMLWALTHVHGWNKGFELAEGYLLGYETGIDHAFKPVSADIPVAQP